MDVPYAIVLGQSEVEEGKPKLRNMKTGDEESLTVDEIVSVLKK